MINKFRYKRKEPIAKATAATFSLSSDCQSTQSNEQRTTSNELSTASAVSLPSPQQQLKPEQPEQELDACIRAVVVSLFLSLLVFSLIITYERFK